MFKIVTSSEDILKVHIVRGIVFIHGQNCKYDEEIDSFESSSIHILGEIDGEPIAAARLRFVDSYAKFERIAVREEFQRKGIGQKLINYMEQIALTNGYNLFAMHAQAHLLEFYKNLGYIREGELFIEADIEHYLMKKSINR
jgi:predicted GNAT family N-acyltransferase